MATKRKRIISHGPPVISEPLFCYETALHFITLLYKIPGVNTSIRQKF